MSQRGDPVLLKRTFESFKLENVEISFHIYYEFPELNRMNFARTHDEFARHFP